MIDSEDTPSLKGIEKISSTKASTNYSDVGERLDTRWDFGRLKRLFVAKKNYMMRDIEFPCYKAMAVITFWLNGITLNGKIVDILYNYITLWVANIMIRVGFKVFLKSNWLKLVIRN